jgi:hypothetical protein
MKNRQASNLWDGKASTKYQLNGSKHTTKAIPEDPGTEPVLTEGLPQFNLVTFRVQDMNKLTVVVCFHLVHNGHVFFL